MAVIWYGEGELGARTGGLGPQQEEGKGVISRWAGSPVVCGKELAFLGVQLQAGPRLLLHTCFPVSSFPACTLQYLAKAGLSPSAAFGGAAEARPVLHPQGCVLSRSKVSFWCQDAGGTPPRSSLLSVQARTYFHTWYGLSRRMQCGNVKV